MIELISAGIEANLEEIVALRTEWTAAVGLRDEGSREGDVAGLAAAAAALDVGITVLEVVVDGLRMDLDDQRGHAERARQVMEEVEARMLQSDLLVARQARA